MTKGLNLNLKIGDYYRLRLWKRNEPELPLYPFAAEETLRINGPRSIKNYHEYFLIIFMLSGEFHHIKDGRKNRLTPGHVLIVPPGLSYGHATEGYHKFLIGMAGRQVEQLFSAFKLNQYFMFQTCIPEILKIHRDISRRLIRKSGPGLPELIGDCMKLLTVLSLSVRDKEYTEEQFLANQVRSKLESEYHNPKSLLDLSTELGVPLTTMQRMFKEKFGTSPKRYQFECRMRHVRDLLESSDMTMKEIAYRTGFQNQYYFSNAVKKEYKLSPGQLRTFLRQSHKDLIMPPKN